jgi:hypothetical protein
VRRQRLAVARRGGRRPVDDAHNSCVAVATVAVASACAAHARRSCEKAHTLAPHAGSSWHSTQRAQGKLRRAVCVRCGTRIVPANEWCVVTTTTAAGAALLFPPLPADCRPARAH